jgi:hypothetical protein
MGWLIHLLPLGGRAGWGGALFIPMLIGGSLIPDQHVAKPSHFVSRQRRDVEGWLGLRAGCKGLPARFGGVSS